jgi:hypothetical protein
MPLVGALLLFMAGCGGSTAADAPPTHPVTGKVTKGGQPMTAGTVEFQPAEPSAQRANAEIQPDGSFALSTFMDLEKFPGAVPGKYKVNVMPPMTADQQVQIFNLPQTYTIEPKENHFEIKIGK